MFTVTVCGALTPPLVPVGTPNERSVGETVSVCAFALPAHIPPAITKPASARTTTLQTLIAASLRGLPITNTVFICGAFDQDRYRAHSGDSRGRGPAPAPTRATIAAGIVIPPSRRCQGKTRLKRFVLSVLRSPDSTDRLAQTISRALQAVAAPDLDKSTRN